MALGRLNSLKTVVSGINTNLELYTSSHNSSNVTIHITNQGIESTRFTVGLSSSGLSNASDSDYIVLGQTLKPREYVSLTNVGISSGNTLYCRASKPDVSFIAFSVFDYIGASSNFGKENSLKTNLTNNTINSNLLLLTAKEDTNVTLSVNNRSFDSSSFSIGISSSEIENFKSSDYLIYGRTINRNESFTISNVVLSTNQSIIVRASTPDIVFSAYSIPVGISTVSYASTAGSLSGSPNIDVGNVYSVGVITATGNLTANDINVNDVNANNAIFGGNVSVGGSVGIGTTNPQTSLEVVSGSYKFGFVGVPSDFSPFPGTDLGAIYIQNVDNIFDNSGIAHLGDDGGLLLTNYRATFFNDDGLYRFGPVTNLVWDIYPAYLNQTFDAFYVGDNVFLASVDNKAYISAPDGIIFGGYGNVGIGTTTPESKLTVVDGDIRVGVDTSNGLILTDSNSVSWRLIVNTDGTITTSAV